ncbi:hypothetical protein AB0H00_12380 [Nocardia sp. NPDC023852]|uniref:hypothetical protein n=1 Tax=Nocardia sp. NPDC023852 TaxID=3154697 RepID=UPI0033E27508
MEACPDFGSTLLPGWLVSCHRDEHDENQFGFRSSAELDRPEGWAAWEMTRAEFERAWPAAA